MLDPDSAASRGKCSCANNATAEGLRYFMRRRPATLALFLLLFAQPAAIAQPATSTPQPQAASSAEVEKRLLDIVQMFLSDPRYNRGKTPAQIKDSAEFVTGKVKWQSQGVGPGAVMYAEGRLYVHGENGDVALVEATPEAYREKGRFTPPDQPKRVRSREMAWAYPVVANGRLYIRDLGALSCFDVKDPKATR